jgi:hypothetical protein
VGETEKVSSFRRFFHQINNMIGGSNVEAILETFSASTAKDITLNLSNS